MSLCFSSMEDTFGMYAGDLGPSYKYKDIDVNGLISASLPNSIALGLVAMILAFFFGMSAGMLAAVKQEIPGWIICPQEWRS